MVEEQARALAAPELVAGTEPAELELVAARR
jgi:hypothetical protein